MAFHALTDDEAVDEGLVITGPKALSYDQAPAIISAARGRPVRHIRLNGEQLTDRFVQSDSQTGMRSCWPALIVRSPPAQRRARRRHSGAHDRSGAAVPCSVRGAQRSAYGERTSLSIDEGLGADVSLREGVQSPESIKMMGYSPLPAS